MSRHQLAGGVLVLSAAFYPLVGVLAPLGLAPLAAVAALGVLPLVVRERAWNNLPRIILGLVAALAVWQLISTLWAISVRDALIGGGRQVLTGLCGLVVLAAIPHLEPVWRRRLSWALLVSVAVAALLLGLEYMTGRGVSIWLAALKHRDVVGNKSSLNRGATVLTLAAWACISMFRFETRRWPLVIAALSLGAMFAGDSLSTQLSITMSIAAAAVVALWPRNGIRLLIVVVVGVWLGVPLAASRIPDPHYTFQHWDWLPRSAHHRVTIWEFTARHIVEKPLLGWGMEASRAMPGGDDEIQVWRYAADGSRTDIGQTEAQLPLHPHNGILQIWLELGGVGALLALAFLITILLRIGRLPPDDRLGRAAAAACMVSALCIGTVSYGVWQSWWQSGQWLAAAFFLAAPLPRRTV